MAATPVVHVRSFHPLPTIGHPREWYERHIRQGEQHGDLHAQASHHVGLLITDAMNPKLPWEHKLMRYRQALGQYCNPPADADEELKTFYKKLCEIVRRHASQEAVRLVRRQHEDFARRVKAGASRDEIADEADMFFPGIVGHSHDCPEWFSNEAWEQIRGMEGAWI